ncbi:MAG: phosphatase PAP2 family protein [Dehalococcoidia bacterium]
MGRFRRRCSSATCSRRGTSAGSTSAPRCSTRRSSSSPTPQPCTSGSGGGGGGRGLAAYTTSVLLTLYVGLALFILLPTVPPWLAAQQGHIFRTYRVLDFVVRGVDVDAYRTLYRTLAEPNSVASVPSIHMALTCVVLLRSRDFARPWFWPLVAYTLLMALALVYLGEHYVFDVLVGIAVAVAVEVVVVRGVRRRRELAVKA